VGSVVGRGKCKHRVQGKKKGAPVAARAPKENSVGNEARPSFFDRDSGAENGFAYLMEDRATEEVEVESSTMSSPPECAGMEFHC
jgi:hypothetical protein